MIYVKYNNYTMISNLYLSLNHEISILKFETFNCYNCRYISKIKTWTQIGNKEVAINKLLKTEIHHSPFFWL